MKKALLSAAILSLSVSAFAEFQIDVDPGQLNDRLVVDCVADIGFAPGMTYYSGNAVSGPDGFPPKWHVVFQQDDLIMTATPFNSMELITECLDGGTESSLITFAPYSVWYLPGPPNPPAADSDFGLFSECVDIVDADEMVTSFALNNAYPNPFNPTTSISFDVAATGPVSLAVFNIAGQEVANLVDGQMSQGSHSVTFDAAQLGSGVYLYTLTAGNFTETKKMVLVK